MGEQLAVCGKNMLTIGPDTERIMKEYIEAPTIFDLKKEYLQTLIWRRCGTWRRRRRAPG